MYFRPVPKTAPVESGFGRRECAGPMKAASCRYEQHTGTDYGVVVGTPARAVADGSIAYVLNKELDGKLVGLNFVDVDGARMQAAYAHLDEILVHKGQSVKAGEVIARTGNTGNSEGPHLHLGVRRNGVRIDPEKWLRSRVDGQDEAIESGDAFPKMGKILAAAAVAAILGG